jgi:hypothetical protein
MAAMYGFSPFTISVGTSYFERLAARDACLMAAARATPEFTAFVAATPVEAPALQRPIGAAHMHLGPKHWCAPCARLVTCKSGDVQGFWPHARLAPLCAACWAWAVLHDAIITAHGAACASCMLHYLAAQPDSRQGVMGRDRAWW